MLGFQHYAMSTHKLLHFTFYILTFTFIKKLPALTGFLNAPHYLCAPFLKKYIFAMPKMKTHSGAKKRFKVTGSGKVKRNRARMRHLMRKKTTKAKRHLRGGVIVDRTEHARIERMLAI